MNCDPSLANDDPHGLTDPGCCTDTYLPYPESAAPEVEADQSDVDLQNAAVVVVVDVDGVVVVVAADADAAAVAAVTVAAVVGEEYVVGYVDPGCRRVPVDCGWTAVALVGTVASGLV
jgi:hypothetical protein